MRFSMSKLNVFTLNHTVVTKPTHLYPNMHGIISRDLPQLLNENSGKVH